jgi:lantibiotic modifying enzyme
MFPIHSDSLTKSFWKHILHSGEETGVRKIAKDMALRLSNPETLSLAIASANKQTDNARWHSPGIAQGDAGLALLCGQMDECFPDTEWDKYAHSAIVRTSSLIEYGYNAIGLFVGLSGLTYTTVYLSRNGLRYKKLLVALDEILLPQLSTQCAKFISAGSYITVGGWDVISGLSGASRYLIARNNYPTVRLVLDKVLECLVILTEDFNGLPRWFTPPELSPGESMQEMYPQGSLNCGMAHGIPGPLAALSLAKIHGIEVEGQEAAIRKIADWLLSHRLDDKYGMNWPSAIAVKNIGTQQSPQYIQTTEGTRHAHTGWCYGPCGVAIALWHAGVALNDENYKDKAIAIMRSVFARSISERGLFNPGMCHGFAGQLQIAMRFYNNTGLPEFADESRRLVQVLMEKYYDPNTLLGFQSQDGKGNKIDQAGLLDGSPGVILALLAASTDVEPKWDQIFMLS